MRAALAILRQEGLIETRRGRNGGKLHLRAARLLVGQVDRTSRLARTLAAARSGLRLMAVTGVVAGLAAKRYDEDNLVRLEDLASRWRSPTRRSCHS
ncbi:hypothetical protein ACHMWU_10110 [Aeromicrobium sp. UC242_57]